MVSPMSGAGWPTAPRRAPRWALLRRPGRWPWSEAVTTCCRRTWSTSRPTCCGTGSCCPMTRSPTRCRSITSSRGSCRPCRCRRCPPVLSRAVAGSRRPRRPAPRGADRLGSWLSMPNLAVSSGSRPAWAPPSLHGGRVEAALRMLEIDVRQRLDGLLQGNHLGLVPGPGTEPGEARPYQPGDDVRRMDWAVTARTTVPHIRDTVADRELETWIVVDLSPSLDFGTAVCEKRELAVAAAAAITHLCRGGGNRIS